MTAAFRAQAPLLSRRARPIVRAMASDKGTKVRVQRMTQASDFAELDSAMVVHFLVISGNEAARALAAELESYLIDRSETLPDLSDAARRESDETAFEFVRRIEGQGAVVCVGLDQAELRFDDDPSKTRAWAIGCIAVSNTEDESESVTVDND